MFCKHLYFPRFVIFKLNTIGKFVIFFNLLKYLRYSLLLETLENDYKHFMQSYDNMCRIFNQYFFFKYTDKFNIWYLR